MPSGFFLAVLHWALNGPCTRADLAPRSVAFGHAKCKSRATWPGSRTCSAASQPGPSPSWIPARNEGRTTSCEPLHSLQQHYPEYEIVPFVNGTAPTDRTLDAPRRLLPKGPSRGLPGGARSKTGPVALSIQVHGRSTPGVFILIKELRALAGRLPSTPGGSTIAHYPGSAGGCRFDPAAGQSGCDSAEAAPRRTRGGSHAAGTLRVAHGGANRRTVFSSKAELD